MVDSGASAGAFAFFDGSRILYTMAIFRIFLHKKRRFFLATIPFDADAGSSSNMASSQPGRPMGLQSSTRCS